MSIRRITCFSSIVSATWAVVLALSVGLVGGCDSGGSGPVTPPPDVYFPDPDPYETPRSKLPSWGPHGAIAFWGWERREPWLWGVWSIDPGEGVRRLLAEAAWAGEWSPDGGSLALEFGQGAIIVWDLETGAVRRLAEANSYAPTWSPDAQRIAYEVGWDSVGIWVMNASDGSEKTHIVRTDAGGFSIWTIASPSWSPSGEWIAFSARHADAFEPDIFVVRPDGSDLERLTGSEVYGECRPRWSPDGTRLVFGADHGIWVLDVRTRSASLVPGTKPHVLLSGQSADWSPDGEWIVYNKVWLWMVRPDGTDNHCIEDTLSAEPPWR